MKIKLADIKSLKSLKAVESVDLPCPDMDGNAKEYLTKFLSPTSYRIANITIDNKESVLKQFTGKPPNLANLGVIQVAFSDYAERYLLDVHLGHVMQFESSILASVLSKAGEQPGNKIRKLLKRRSKYVFKNLVMMFWCFEDLED